MSDDLFEIGAGAHMYSETRAEASAAISLKRIADALEVLADAARQSTQVQIQEREEWLRSLNP